MTEKNYAELMMQYNELAKSAGRNNAVFPIGASGEETDILLKNLDTLKKRLKKELPDLYIEYLRTVGLHGISYAPDHEMFLYRYKDLFEFNIGDSSYEEMQEYLLFGEDGGSYSWFFDVKNKLGKGKDAVYIFDRGAPMIEEYFIYKGKDFYEVIENFAQSKELEDEYTFKSAPPTEDEIAAKDTLGKQILKEIDERLERNPEEAEKVYADMKKIQEYIQSVKTSQRWIEMTDGDFVYIDEVEKGFKQELPLLYLAFMCNRRGGEYESENFDVSFIEGKGISELNTGKLKKKYLKGYFRFAQGD